MWKSNLLVIVGILACIGIWWHYRQEGRLESQQEVSSLQQEGSQAVIPPETEDTPVSPAKAEVQQELVDVQQRLEMTRASLVEKRQQLETLAGGGETTPAESSEIYSEDNQSAIEQDVMHIQDLNARLDELSMEEGRLMAVGEAPAVEETQATMAARDQIDEQIRQMEETMQTTQSEIQEWENNNSYVNEKEENLARLQSTLEGQRSTLENLRENRNNLFNNALTTSQEVQSEKENRLNEISNAKLSLQQEISALRAQVGQRQGQSYESQVSRMGDQEEYSILREAYEEERREYQMLEQEKNRLESQLLAL